LFLFYLGEDYFDGARDTVENASYLVICDSEVGVDVYLGNVFLF